MRPDDANRPPLSPDDASRPLLSPDDALGQRLRADAAPVPPAGADLRRRIEALTGSEVVGTPERPGRLTHRALPFVAALAAGVLFFLALPRGNEPTLTVSVEERFVLDTLASAFDDGADGTAWDGDDEEITSGDRPL